MEINMDFDVLKDEIGLYLLGVISKEELFETINNIREGYGFEPLEEFPKRVEKSIELADGILSSNLGW